MGLTGSRSDPTLMRWLTPEAIQAHDNLPSVRPLLCAPLPLADNCAVDLGDQVFSSRRIRSDYLCGSIGFQGITRWARNQTGYDYVNLAQSPKDARWITS
jgi:hypothetical protein